MSKRIEPLNYRCDGCRAVATGSCVRDYSGYLLRLMLPERWRRSLQTASTVEFLSFLCPKCAEKEKDQEVSRG